MEKVFLVGVQLNKDEHFAHAMDELAALAEAAEMEVVGRAVQALDNPHTGLYIGPGKAEEVKIAAESLGADVILFEDSLSPSQQRNLQDLFRTKDPNHTVAVMDRSALILEIFASRARSREARLQVEVARLKYLLPRLVGMHEALSRQGGASGSMSNRGAGEKKLELDRRRLEKRLSELRKELDQVVEERKTQRKRRALSGIPRIALVGYTNAGKSTLMNGLLDAYAPDEVLQNAEKTEEKKVFEKDMLFATLDTTVRKIEPDGHQPMLFSDTVGFVDKLPHHLVEAFKSTLEEAAESDVLLQVVDYADPHHKEQIQVTNETLHQLGADRVPQILVYNKVDLALEMGNTEEKLPSLPMVRRETDPPCIYISAKKGIGLEELLALVEEKLAGGFCEGTLLIPYTDGRALSYLNEHGVVRSTEYLPEGTKIALQCRKEDWEYYKKYELG